ncbi:hypothetical protein F1C16_04585 [Hymenobacter sp. NBH84]|uniref:hypothetical protein n=1 Tax=Hymenobacter sp. NBH84 TaxID=2596915 RepID=UPI0016259BDC|nr:hypothetical protein [Hymenobacter sp. NBH84]QNE38883.1 hypothetical protein F1C16_04585 [Hymenobacter sp. NBH84]
MIENMVHQEVAFTKAYLEEIREWYKYVFGISPSYELVDVNDISLLRFNLGDGQHDVIVKTGYTEPYDLRVRGFWGVNDLQSIFVRFKELQPSYTSADEPKIIISNRDGESSQYLALEDPHGYILQLTSYSLDNKVVRSCKAY